ncbi:MAG: histidine--tRNA ligase [Coriobacteriales bacterium]
MAYKAPKGTQDLLPAQARAWEAFKTKALQVFGLYGYEPVETPIFEKAELFLRGCGETCDAATKEIFSVFSLGAVNCLKADQPLKSDQKLALRPEGTASVVRAIAEHNLVPQGGAPAKLLYAGPMFRCERPQKGRLRQFHQVGIECLGATDPSADAEMIIMCMRFFEELGLKRESMTLLINSMGCKECRPGYTAAVKTFMEEHRAELCEECQRRIETNPLRAFDCKNPQCYEVMEAAPRFSEHLCPSCQDRHEKVCSYLQAAGIGFTEDPRLVRGFDYYTGTVFEVQVSEGLGAQSAIGGGGRYDGLMGEVGDRDLPGLGFAVGFERIMLALEAAGVCMGCSAPAPVYVAVVDDSVRTQAFAILHQLRDAGIRAEGDTQGRSLKSQFKVAGKMEAPLAVVVGPDELSAGMVTIRDFNSHEERQVALGQVTQEVTALLAR